MNPVVQILFAFAASLIAFESLANAPEEEIYVRKSDGFVVQAKTDGEQVLNWITQNDAEAICDSLGARLPTSLELAQEAVKYGSVLKKPNAEGKCDPEDGEFFDLVSNENGPYFCYSYVNYVRPEGDLGYYWVWSSSLAPRADGYAYLLHGLNGDYGYISRSKGFKNTAVRCFFE